MDWTNDFPTVVDLPVEISEQLPPNLNFQDVRYTPELVEHFITRYTRPGDTVLDPFVGFGTTVVVAQQLDRKGYGIEISSEKVAYLRESLGLEHIVHGDIKRLFLDKVLPPIDFVMCSPPYMNKNDQANALTGYRYAGSYETYLSEMADIFGSIKEILTNNAVVVVEISNLKHDDTITTLAWDVGGLLAGIFTFRGEVIINWQGKRSEDKQGIYNYGYDHSYCLVYSNTTSL